MLKTSRFEYKYVVGVIDLPDWKMLENLENSQTMWGNHNKYENKQLTMWKSTKIQINICPILVVSPCTAMLFEWDMAIWEEVLE